MSLSLNQSSTPSWGVFAVVSLLLYLLALGLQLPGITTLGPQPDEIHWQSRSYQILKTARLGDYTQLTTHLPHPGIPAAYAMAAGQYLGERYNHSRGLSPWQPGYLDPLAAARIANALVSSAAIPLLFWGGLLVFGFWPSVAAAFLFAFDPHFIGLSRQAHMDSILTLLILATTVVFLRSLLCPSRKAWLYAAALLWGLSLAVKPTAILLLPGLACARLFAWLLPPFPEQRIKLLSWHDVWAGVSALALFGVLYTRLWHPITTQGYKLNAWLGKEIWIDRLGALLQKHPGAVLAGISLLLALSAFGFWKSSGKQSALLALANCSALLSLFLGLFFLVPHFLKNYAGYWLWTFGLSGEAHYAYGRYWEPPPQGYFGMAATKLPSLVLLGIAAACGAWLFRIFRARHQGLRTTSTVLVLLIAAFCLWAIGLGISDKQAYRYLVPVVPGLYLLAGWGWGEVAAALSALPGLRPGFVHSAFYPALAVLQVFGVLPWLGHPLLFFNSLSGGLPAAIARGEYLSLEGQNEAVDFLQVQAERLGRPIRVAVHGDPQAMNYTYSRRFPEVQEAQQRLVRFRTWTHADPGEYLLAHRSFVERSPKIAEDLSERTSVFRWGVEGVPLLAVYPGRVPTSASPQRYLAAVLPHRTGQLKRFDENGPELLVAEPGRHRRDYLFNNAFVPVQPGLFRVKVRLGPHPTAAVPADIDQERYALRFDLGSRCSRIATLADVLQAAEGREFGFDCEVGKQAYLQLRAYWFGAVPVAVEQLEVLGQGNRSENG